MSMNEDAMFKALLKNKPQQQKTSQAQATKEVKPAASASKPSYSKNSEDAMFQVLLKNKPQQVQPQQKTQARPEPVHVPAPQPAGKASQAIVETYETEEPVVQAMTRPVVTQTVNPVQNMYSPESIEKLASSVNMVYGLLKTATIVLVLILVVGIAVLIKLP